MKRFLFAICSLTFFACGSTASVTTESAAPAKPNDMCCANCVNPNLGKIVEVKGVLQNTRLAPSIDAKGFSVYCMDVLMPDGAHGKQAIATGRLERTDQYAARVTKDGGHIAGTGGGDLVLLGCKLQVIESE
jgi:hypothetical protein